MLVGHAGWQALPGLRACRQEKQKWVHRGQEPLAIWDKWGMRGNEAAFADSLPWSSCALNELTSTEILCLTGVIHSTVQKWTSLTEIQYRLYPGNENKYILVYLKFGSLSQVLNNWQHFLKKEKVCHMSMCWWARQAIQRLSKTPNWFDRCPNTTPKLFLQWD